MFTSCGQQEFSEKISIFGSNPKSPPPIEHGDPSPENRAEYGDYQLFENMLQFDLEISGCASGFSQIFEKSTLNSVKLFKNDRNCLAKLLRFTAIDGIEYTPKVGATFTTYLAGDFAIFTDSTQQKNLKITVISQLSSPISPDDYIDYRFSSLSSDSDAKSLLQSKWDDIPITLTNPEQAPRLKIKQVVFTDIKESSRLGKFDFYLECETLMSGSNCSGVSERDLRFGLHNDVGNNCSPATPSQCETSSRLSLGATPIGPGQHPLLPNGGFLLQKVETPVPLAESSHLILQILREKNNSAKPPIREAIRVWNFDLDLTVHFEMTEIGAVGLSLLEEE